MVSWVEELREIGLGAGLHKVGFASAEPFDDVRVAIEERRRDGLHGGMQFTFRNPARSTDPSRAMPSVQSLVVGALGYPAVVAPPDRADQAKGPLARVARYATGDHYSRLRDALEQMADRLRSQGFSARVLADDNAMVDRAAAHRAGIGWYGKNANILIDGVGSWFVLGSVLTDAALSPLTDSNNSADPAASRPMGEGCGGCTRCLSGCPTGAIVAPGIVDARRCLAWLVQAEGIFPAEFRVALGDRIYGCDVCQEVCPPSARTERSEKSVRVRELDQVEQVEIHHDNAAVASPSSGTWVSLLEILAATDHDLLDRHGRWYIPRREPRYLRRNALVALANVAEIPVASNVRNAVGRYCRHRDPMLRAHAVWAARRLGLDDLWPALADDPDPMVRAELAADVSVRSGSGVDMKRDPQRSGANVR